MKFQVTHPFHPWHGRRFVLATRKVNWGEGPGDVLQRRGSFALDAGVVD
jgi:hypothetical protein